MEEWYIQRFETPEEKEQLKFFIAGKIPNFVWTFFKHFNNKNNKVGPGSISKQRTYEGGVFYGRAE